MFKMFGFPSAFQCFRVGGHTLQKASLDNAFSMFLELFFAFWLKKSSKSICFIRYFDRILGHVEKLISIGFIRFSVIVKAQRRNLL